jgi:hypothetical protein
MVWWVWIIDKISDDSSKKDEKEKKIFGRGQREKPIISIPNTSSQFQTPFFLDINQEVVALVMT